MQLSRRAEWATFIGMTLLWGFVGLNRIGIAYLFPILRPLFHLQFTQVGLLISGTSITWALSTLIGGYLSDRIGLKPIYFIGMLSAAVFSSLIGVSWNFLSLFIVRDLIGLGDGVGWSVGQGIVGKIASPTRRAFFQGFVSAGYTLVGVGVGAFVITQLAIHIGWRNVYWILAIPAILVVLFLMKLLPAMPAGQRTSQTEAGTATRLSFKAYFSLFRTWQMAVLILLNIIVLVWIQGFLGFAPLFLQQLKYSLATSGLIITMVGLFGTVGQLALPYLSDLIGRKPVSIGALVISALCLIVASLISLPTFALA
ncbi:MAG: MFS transporter, partial [Chloroflexi bacterium]|nr:MFS transporter [Chloroflexota bacterium]